MGIATCVRGDSAPARTACPASFAANSGRPYDLGPTLLRCAVLVLIAGRTLYGRNVHDVLAGSLPGLLDDPGERAILTGRLGPDLLQHLLRKVETLFALVTGGHATSVREPAPEGNLQGS